MIDKTLTVRILVGRSSYPVGTTVLVGEPLYEGTRHECVLVRFPKGEETFLRTTEVK